MSIQRALLYLSIHTHGFAVPAMLDTGAMWSFVSHKLAAKLPATIQTMRPLIIMLLTGKMLVATSSIKLNMLIDNFIYI